MLRRLWMRRLVIKTIRSRKSKAFSIQNYILFDFLCIKSYY